MKIIILAGGSGTRLWPVSRKNKPKQVQVFFDSSTLLQKTWTRLNKFFPSRDIFIATTSSQIAMIRKDLPMLPVNNILVEPEARGTLPALVLASINIINKFPNEVVTFINSDHYIDDVKEYAKTLKQASDGMKQHQDVIGLIGIKPTFPDTGYGYIKIGKPLPGGIYQVDKFVEKPNLAKAISYLKQKKFFWNPGYFIFYPQTLLNLMSETYPKLTNTLSKLKDLSRVSKNSKTWIKYFRQLPATSIDYGLLEKTKKLILLPAKFSFADIGNWRAVYDILSRHQGENVVRGNYVGVESHGNLIYSTNRKLITTIGIHDSIIIETPDALLVCPKSQAQEVRVLVQALQKNNGKKFV